MPFWLPKEGSRRQTFPRFLQVNNMQTHKCAFLKTIKDHLLVMRYRRLTEASKTGVSPEFTGTHTTEEADGHPRIGEAIIAFEPRQVFGILTNSHKDCLT